jgi:CheY-like chemotaxis protein
MSRPTDDTSADSGEEGQEQPNRSRRYRLEADESTSGKKILVVDDSAMIRLTVCEIAKQLGHQAIEAADGVEAVALARSCDPDLIVLDVHMEEMSGVEALKELRADARFADTAIIMLTVDASRQVFREAIDLKADDYLVKPISNETLRERIEKCLS